MYQESCLKHNFEQRDYIFDNKLPLNNINHEELQKYIFFLSELLLFKYFMLIFLSTELEVKSFFIFETVYQRIMFYLFCGFTSDPNNFFKFTCEYL